MVGGIGESKEEGNKKGDDMMRKTLLWSLVSWVLAIAVFFMCNIAKGEVRGGFEAQAEYSLVNGFIQVPIGGSATSRNRPTLQELNIISANTYHLGGYAGIDKHLLYVSAYFCNMKGDSVLTNDLLSHGHLFTAGTHVKSKIVLNEYDFGYRYNGLEYGDFTISPMIGITMFDFSYEVMGNGHREERSYIKTATHVGCNVDWQVTDDFVLSTNGKSTVPLHDMPLIASFGIDGKYRLYGETFGFLGVGYKYLDYEGGNRGKIHNHTRVIFGPVIYGGVRVNF